MRGIKNIRLKKFDYKSDGYYFVTVVADKRENIFKGREQEIESEPTDLKNKTLGLSLDYFVIMPNHAHIIFILRQCSFGLGEVVRRFKAKVSHKFQMFVWQPNYYEHVVRNEKALEKIRQYVINNPQEEIIKFEQFYK